MKHTLLLILLVVSGLHPDTATLLRAQHNSCTPQFRSRVVCDSVRELCRSNAQVMALQSISEPASPWHDSLLCPRELTDRYTEALIAFYNDLPDTLADFRWYLQMHKTEHPDSGFTAILDIPHEALDTLRDRTPGCGSARIDSLMDACGFEFVSVMTLHSLDRSAEYRTKQQVNRAYVARKLRAINTAISMSGVYYSGVGNYMQMKDLQNRIEITVSEFSKCMPPELPCAFIRRTFVFRAAYPLMQTSFERGVLPWPFPEDR